MNVDTDHNKMIISKVKEQKNYKTISDDIIENEIEKCKKKYHVDLYDKKFIVKKIRKELHRLYGSYQTKKKRKRYDYLEELKKGNTKEVIENLLSITVSTKERINFYEKLYQWIFSLQQKAHIITDLGCGMNPLSFPFMNKKPIVYSAIDIDKDDIDFLNSYFSIMKKKGLFGIAKIMDITDLEKLKSLEYSDIFFMFKTIDLIDSKQKKVKKISEELLKLIIKKTKLIIISFSTKTLGRRNMNLPRRRGFELMIERNKWNYIFKEFPNEIFYAVWS